MNPQKMGTDDLIELAKDQIDKSSLDDAVLHELQARYGRRDCPPNERAAIVELDRSVFIPLFGYTKLPSGIIRIPGAKAASSPGPKPSKFSSPSAEAKDVHPETIAQVGLNAQGEAAVGGPAADIHLQNGSDHGGGYRWFCLGCHNGFGLEEPGMMSSWSD